MSILPAAPMRPPAAKPAAAPAPAPAPAAPPIPDPPCAGAGAIGRGRMARSLVPPAEVAVVDDDAGDDLDETDATDRGEGPFEGDGVLAEMLTTVA